MVDSDVLIAHLRGVAVATTWLLDERSKGPLSVSVVSVVEITGGMRSSERPVVWSLLRALRTVGVDELVARRAGQLMRAYRRSHGAIGLGDYLIAATADVHGFDLATLNVKHFPMFDSLAPAFPASR